MKSRIWAVTFWVRGLRWRVHVHSASGVCHSYWPTGSSVGRLERLLIGVVYGSAGGGLSCVVRLQQGGYWLIWDKGNSQSVEVKAVGRRAVDRDVFAAEVT